jgi:hypothetical protein
MAGPRGDKPQIIVISNQLQPFSAQLDRPGDIFSVGAPPQRQFVTEKWLNHALSTYSVYSAFLTERPTI